MSDKILPVENFYRFGENSLGALLVNLSDDIIEDVKGKDLFISDKAGASYREAFMYRANSFPLEHERELFCDYFAPDKLLEHFEQGDNSFARLFLSRREDGKLCYVKISVRQLGHSQSGKTMAIINEVNADEDKVKEVLLSSILLSQYDMISYISQGHYGVVIGDPSRITRGSIFPEKRQGLYHEYLDAQVYPVLCDSESGVRSEKMARALSLDTVREEAQKHSPYSVNIACLIDGEIYYKTLDYYAIDAKADYYIVLKSDTTDIFREQMRRNNELRDALKEAEAANVAKTAFLSSMSHEIRTPLNAIIGIDSIALKDAGISEHTHEQLEKIGSSAKHLLSLINDILDMSRIESGRMSLKNEEFRMRNLLEQVNTLADSQCSDKGLEYECRVEGSLDECYIGDEMKLKQVLINIIGNAVKFTDKGGRVSLSLKRINKFEDQSTLEFRIKDSGIGMDKDFVPKIFEAFSQEDASATNRYGGSGLGLAITKNIVELMNGSISVVSEKGVGSEFIVNVSLKNTESEKLSGLGIDMRPQDFNVLCVDDDPVAREHAKLVLEEIGISSEVAASGEEALEMIRLASARNKAFNLLLVDLKMPGMDGIELTKKIRELSGNESAIVILTAYSWSDVEDEAKGAGADSFMSKPLFGSEVLEQFAQAMRRKESLHPSDVELADLSGRRILMAEDVDINAEILKELLEMMDMEAERAENGAEAIEMFEEHAAGYYDAILMDIRMPVLGGLGATAAIRDLERMDAKTIPIIAMTANAFDEDVQRSLQAGMNAHLTKPVEPERLYDTLARLIKD